MPCHNAHRAIGGHIASHRHIAVAGIGAPTVIHIAGIFPLFQTQRQREAVDGAVSPVMSNSRSPSSARMFISAVGKAQGVAANATMSSNLLLSSRSHRWWHQSQAVRRNGHPPDRPAACPCSRKKPCPDRNAACRPVCTRLCHHDKEAAQAVILRCTTGGAQRPPKPKHFCSVRAVKQCAKTRVDELGACISPAAIAASNSVCCDIRSRISLPVSSVKGKHTGFMLYTSLSSFTKNANLPSLV